MITRVEVKYKGFNTELDEVIRNALEDAGLRWYGQGYAFSSDTRDMCFDYEDGKEGAK